MKPSAVKQRIWCEHPIRKTLKCSLVSTSSRYTYTRMQKMKEKIKNPVIRLLIKLDWSIFALKSLFQEIRGKTHILVDKMEFWQIISILSSPSALIFSSQNQNYSTLNWVTSWLTQTLGNSSKSLNFQIPFRAPHLPLLENLAKVWLNCRYLKRVYILRNWAVKKSRIGCSSYNRFFYTTRISHSFKNHLRQPPYLVRNVNVQADPFKLDIVRTIAISNIYK